MTIIEVNNLSKQYSSNDFYSLKDANFTIQEGEIVGLVGKNGSGKSTLLKMMAKSQRPTEGSVLFKGQDMFKTENVLDDFGIMIEPVFFPQISVEENLKLYLKIHQKESYLTNIEPILKLVDLWNVKDRKPDKFSFGMKQRTALALALITEPKCVLLDEPFVGLDPNGVENLLAILKQWAKTNKTSMLISSHQLTELEHLCDRYLFIENGVIRQFDSTQPMLLIELNDPQDGSDKSSQLIDQLVQLYKLSYAEGILELPEAMDNQQFNELLEQLAAEKLVRRVLQQKDGLEKLFRGTS